MDSNAPVDRNKFVYIIFVWLGVGTLLPWNFFITQTSYWNERYRDLSCDGINENSYEVDKTEDLITTEGSGDTQANTSCTPNNDMQRMWNSKMAVASMIPNVTMLILNAVFGHRFRTQPRLLVSLILVIVFFAVTAGLTKVDTDTWQNEFMTLTLVTVVCINLNAAIFQGGLTGVAGKFPSAYIGGVFSGQALSGIFASSVAVVMIAIGATPQGEAFFCFLVAVIFLTGTLVLYVVVTRTNFYQYYSAENVFKIDSESKNVYAESSESLVKEKHDSGCNACLDSFTSKCVPHKVNALNVLGRIWIHAASVLLVFAVTLCCFPTLAVLKNSVNAEEHSVWAKNYFIPVCCFLLFNVGDYTGRIAAEKIQFPKSAEVERRYTLGSTIVLLISAARSVFIPLFLYCNEFNSDTAYIVIMVLFSFSNGYLCNICMMSAPKICQKEDKMTASNLMAAALGIGLCTGAALSNALVLLT